MIIKLIGCCHYRQLSKTGRGAGTGCTSLHRQHYKTITIVVHSVFQVDILDAVELLPLLILSSLLDDPPKTIIFLLLFLLLVLLDIADAVDATNYLFFALVVAIDAVLVFLDQPDLPHLASASHLCQGHPTTL